MIKHTSNKITHSHPNVLRKMQMKEVTASLTFTFEFISKHGAEKNTLNYGGIFWGIKYLFFLPKTCCWQQNYFAIALFATFYNTTWTLYWDTIFWVNGKSPITCPPPIINSLTLGKSDNIFTNLLLARTFQSFWDIYWSEYLVICFH